MDRINEIYQTLRRNTLRTMLTAFGVSWGIFVLIIILGLGKGLENGVQQMFSGFASNGVFVWAQGTSMAYKGHNERRRIELDLKDIDYLKKKIEGIDIIAPRNQLGGYMGGNNVKFKNETGAFSIMGDVPDIIKVYQWLLPAGRFINETDMEEGRKVAVIGKRVHEILFKGQNPVGEYISINGVNFKVVGIFKPQVSGEMAQRDEQSIIIPFSTFQKAFNSRNVNWIAATGQDWIRGSELENQIKDALKYRHEVHPDDPRVFGGFNVERMFVPMQMTFKTVNFIAWFVGIMTLIAGVIGVSNIMLVIIKERTREIGIRRALGASPLNIISQIILESLALTVFAGYMGMMAGIWLIEGLQKMNMNNEMFKDPEIKISIAVTALAILVISGCLAGILPANRALRIKPVEALRYE